MLISIVTSTYNSVSTLPRLIDSFRKAMVPDVEWIVVDNVSTDGTVKLLEEASDVISRFISESDRGIYDAWNKGIRLARGGFVGFIGSDDYIAETYFSEALHALDKNHNIIGFHIAVRKDSHTVMTLHTRQYKQPYNYPFDLGFFHVGTLHDINFFRHASFDISYRICGDREFLVRNASILTPKIHLTKEPLIFFSLGGRSSSARNRNLIAKEDLRTFNYLMKTSRFSLRNTGHYFSSVASIVYTLIRNQITNSL